MKRRHWVMLGIAALAVTGTLTAVAIELSWERAYSNRAVAQSRQLLQACEAYRDNPDNPVKKFPATLSDLVKPPFGGPSFLRDGDLDLIDPWNNPYRYAVIPNARGEQELYVWGERVVDGRLKLHGAKRRADGQVEMFGLE